MDGPAQLQQFRTQALAAGGQARVDRQHSLNKLTARERINILVDPGSFLELDQLALNDASWRNDSDDHLGDGVTVGLGTIAARQVALFAQDFTINGGSLAPAHARKIVKLMDLAVKTGVPIIGLNDSGGARIQYGVESLAGYADIFYRNVRASGVVPQISVILGPCAGGAVYSPALTDFVVMTQETSCMFLTGPDVIRQVTKEEVTKEELGGPSAHVAQSGVAHLVGQDEHEALQIVNSLLSYIPQNNNSAPPAIDCGDLINRTDDALEGLIPQDSAKPYDMRLLIRSIADGNSFFEIQAGYADNILIGFVRLGGESVGVVANQPMVLAGCLDINASTKAARFVRFCDAFNIPLLTLVDVPGFLPGTDQEFGGIIRHGAKLLYAFAEATVPKVTLIVRKAYGGAYCVMSSKHIDGDLNFAYPTAEIAVMGAQGAIQILHREELLKAKQEGRYGEESERLLGEFRREHLSPWRAAHRGFIDDVIEPRLTRPTLIRAFSLLRSKAVDRPRRRHGNIPL